MPSHTTYSPRKSALYIASSFCVRWAPTSVRPTARSRNRSTGICRGAVIGRAPRRFASRPSFADPPVRHAGQRVRPRAIAIVAGLADLAHAVLPRRDLEAGQGPARLLRGGDLGDDVDALLGGRSDDLERLVEERLGPVEGAEQRLRRAVLEGVAKLLADLDLARLGDREALVDHRVIDLRDVFLDANVDQRLEVEQRLGILLDPEQNAREQRRVDCGHRGVALAADLRHLGIYLVGGLALLGELIERRQAEPSLECGEVAGPEDVLHALVVVVGAHVSAGTRSGKRARRLPPPSAAKRSRTSSTRQSARLHRRPSTHHRRPPRTAPRRAPPTRGLRSAAASRAAADRSAALVAGIPRRACLAATYPAASSRPAAACPAAAAAAATSRRRSSSARDPPARSRPAAAAVRRAASRPAFHPAACRRRTDSVRSSSLPARPRPGSHRLAAARGRSVAAGSPAACRPSAGPSSRSGSTRSSSWARHRHRPRRRRR